MQRAGQLGVRVQPDDWIRPGPRPDGSFPPGQAFEASQLEPGGQTGFEEGNAVQYTWSVPQDLAGLATLMGGDHAATAKLATFFTQLNATRNAALRLVGQRTKRMGSVGVRLLRRSLADPARRPCHRRRPSTRTRRSTSPATTTSAPSRRGTSGPPSASSPSHPATADLALASPFFPYESILLPDGHRLVLHAPGAAASRPYIQALTATGIAHPPAASTPGVCASPVQPSVRTRGTCRGCRRRSFSRAARSTSPSR